MFSTTKQPRLFQRAGVAFSLVRSFLLLEDDVDVDWEVDTQERATSEHPHRALRRTRSRVVRRAGQLHAAPQVCVCPVRRAAPRERRHANEPPFRAARS